MARLPEINAMAERLNKKRFIINLTRFKLII